MHFVAVAQRGLSLHLPQAFSFGGKVIPFCGSIGVGMGCFGLFCFVIPGYPPLSLCVHINRCFWGGFNLYQLWRWAVGWLIRFFIFYYYFSFGSVRFITWGVGVFLFVFFSFPCS